MGKQDCEINEAKSLLPKIIEKYPGMDFIWLADSTHGTGPFIKKILEYKKRVYISFKKAIITHYMIMPSLLIMKVM